MSASFGGRFRNYLHAATATVQPWWVMMQAVAGRFVDNKDLLWASALTYGAALSIVSLLVLAFAALKGLGITDQLQPVVSHYAGSPDIAGRLMAYVHNMKVAALGSVGAASLIITDITLLGTIEGALNNSWGVPRGRSILRKFTDYLSVTFTVPLLLASAITLTAGLTRNPAFAFVASFLLVWVGYLFLFWFFPNTRVEWIPAIIGSLITAVLWTVAQWAYIHFQYGVSSYRAEYGALAAIPVFLVWIYVSWDIVLFGVECSVVLQRGPYRPMKETIPPDFTRRLVLLILLRIGERMEGGSEPVTSGTIAHQFGVPEEHIAPIISSLKQAGLLAEAQTETGSAPSQELLLTRSPRAVRLIEVLESAGTKRHTIEPRIEHMLARIGKVERSVLRDATVAELVGDDGDHAYEHAHSTNAQARPDNSHHN